MGWTRSIHTHIDQPHNLCFQVVLDNGIVKVVFSVPGGDVIGIRYKGLDILEMRNDESNRG